MNPPRPAPDFKDRIFWNAGSLGNVRVPYRSWPWWKKVFTPDRDRYPTNFDNANVVSSTTYAGTHRPVIDLDRGAYFVPSSTPGHGHLYLDTEMGSTRYLILLVAMRIAGVIELGFLLHSIKRRGTFVRLPHVKKEPGT